MRKFVIAVIALLVPFSMYAAGCRQDSNQAAFPKGPEVKNIASAGSVEAAYPTVPVIPPAIDPEVMQSPDQPTFARIRAVMDREAQLTSNFNSDPGLFVLPGDSAPAMAAAPQPIQPAQFFQPVQQPIQQPTPQPAAAYAPDDMYAMAPTYMPQRVLPIGAPGLEPLPEPVPVPASAPASRPDFWSRPVAPITAVPSVTPLPTDVQAMSPPSAWKPAEPPDALMMPESIPGIYMGTDDASDPAAGFGPLGMKGAAGDSLPPPAPSFAAVSKPDKLPELAAPPMLPALPPVEHLSSWVKADDVEKALQPLDSLFGIPEPSASKPAEIVMPNLAEVLIRESESIKPSSNGTVNSRDLYRMDFWDDKPGSAVKPGMMEYEAPKSVIDNEVSIAAKPGPEEAPQKVRLRPLVPMRIKSQYAIDAEVAPPPIR